MKKHNAVHVDSCLTAHDTWNSPRERRKLAYCVCKPDVSTLTWPFLTFLLKNPDIFKSLRNCHSGRCMLLNLKRLLSLPPFTKLSMWQHVLIIPFILFKKSMIAAILRHVGKGLLLLKCGTFPICVKFSWSQSSLSQLWQLIMCNIQRWSFRPQWTFSTDLNFIFDTSSC